MFIKETSGGIILSVKVIPGSSRDEIAGAVGDDLKIKIASAPEKGKANKALVKFLSGSLKIPRSDISITKGRTSARKLLKIKRINKAAMFRALEQYKRK